jgi:adenylate cyclase class IV
MVELKVRLNDYAAVEEKLKSLGAVFVEKSGFVDTYFNQPDGEVFKVCDTDKGYFLMQFKRTPQATFQILKNNPIEHADQVIAEMTNEYGVKAVLHGKRIVYTLKDLKVTICLIAERGAFLIATGENPTQDFMTTTLALPTPEYITDSFANLPQVAFTLPAE